MPYDLHYYLQLSYEFERTFRQMQAKWEASIPCWLTMDPYQGHSPECACQSCKATYHFRNS